MEHFRQTYLPLLSLCLQAEQNLATRGFTNRNALYFHSLKAHRNNINTDLRIYRHTPFTVPALSKLTFADER